MRTPDRDHLIDLSLEDDALLPPTLNDEFVGFRLSVSERGCSQGRLLPATAGTQSRSNDYEPDRKSLSWHAAFLINDGILDAEELMLFNRGLRKKDLQNKAEPRTTLSRSCSMPRVPAKRFAPVESAAVVHKKPRSWPSASAGSSFVQSSSSSGSSVKNMLKSSISFLKKKVGPGNKASSASSSLIKFPSEMSFTNIKANGKRPAHPGRNSMPKMPISPKNRLPLSPSTPPYKKSSRFYAEGPNLSAKSISFSSTPPTKETMFRTPSSRPSGLRLPSARFGFFDLEQKSSSSRWEETFYTAPKSTPQETTTSSATRAAKKLRGSELSPVPYLPTPQSDAVDKENKISIEAAVDDLTKHLVSIDLDTDQVIDLQGKKQVIQLCTPTDHSANPLKRAVLTRRTPLAEHNKSPYSSTSSRY